MPFACHDQETPPISTAPASYGDAVQQLEQLLAQLESGQLPLGPAGPVPARRRAAALRRERLQALEEQVKVLDEQGAVHGLDA
jgi:exodeoxyribonuclease VII small subunit